MKAKTHQKYKKQMARVKMCHHCVKPLRPHSALAPNQQLNKHDQAKADGEQFFSLSLRVCCVSTQNRHKQ